VQQTLEANGRADGAGTGDLKDAAVGGALVERLPLYGRAAINSLLACFIHDCTRT
jgi:hypothetical protein